MIRTEALTRSFRSGKQTVEAVRGINLDVAEGELVAFLGPNGAGKSFLDEPSTGMGGSELPERGHAGDVELSFRVDVGQAQLPAVLRELTAQGVEVRTASLHQPTHDDVFLALTGRSLREGANAR